VATGLQTGSTVGIFSMLSSVTELHVDRSSSETMRPPPLIYWTPSRIHAATSVAKQRPCWCSRWTGGYGPPNLFHRWNIFCYQAYQSCMWIGLASKHWDLHHWSTGLQAGSRQPPLWQSRHFVGGGLGPVATGLQTGSTVAIISKLSTVQSCM